MKKTLSLAVSYPILLGIGWFCTKLSERYGRALDDLYVDFDYE